MGNQYVYLREDSVQFNSVQLLSRVRLFVTPWIAACQASLSFTISQSLLKLMSIELVMPSNHFTLCLLLLLLPTIFTSIRVFSNQLSLHIRWPKYWSFNLSISPSNEYSGLYSWQLKMETLYTVSENKTWSWLWFRSWAHHCKILA